MKLKQLFVLAICVFTVPAAMAATIYTNESAFITAVGSAQAALPAVLPSTASFSAAPFTFTADPGQTFVIDTSVYGKAIPGDGNLLLNGYESHELLSSVVLYAFGFKMFQPSNAAPTSPTNPVACYFTCDAGMFSVSLFNGSTLVDSFSFTPVYDTVEFHGYAGTAAFNRIRIEDTLKTIDDEYFSTYRYSTSPAAAPEPAAVSLILVGLIGLGVVSRSRK